MDDIKYKKSKCLTGNLLTVDDTPIREYVDLRPWDSVIENQGTIGSCTSHAVTSAYELLLKMQYPDQYQELSRLFVYYNSRSLEDLEYVDIGSTIYSAILSIVKFGVCKESLWPYIEENWNREPSNNAYFDAKYRTISQYYYMSTVDSIVDALNDNRPVVVGLAVSDDFSRILAEDPVVKVPTKAEQVYGHALVLVGYDREARQFLAKNSFGSAWGIEGYAFIPFDYIESELYEAWTFDIQINQPLRN